MQFPFPLRVALLLLTQISTITSQQFDTVPGCIPPGTKTIFTKTLSCPCYLGYSLHSPIDTNLTTDFLLLRTAAYNVWKRTNFTSPPSTVPQHSTLNASTTSTLSKPPVETPAGSHTFIIRTHADKPYCTVRVSHIFTHIPTCERLGNKIIGGAPIPGLSKHMAILETPIGFCSGTLISKRHILTAAHCNTHTGTARIGNRTAPTYAIASFTTHPDYHPTPGLPQSDIGIVTLSHPMHPTHGIPLPYARTGDITSTVTIAGFGQTHERIPLTPDSLRAARVEAVPLPACRTAFAEHGFGGVGGALTGGMVCLGGECGDSCYGDSGGAALVAVGGDFVVVGIVSAGVGCGRPGIPGVYTRVVEFADWVGRVVGVRGVEIIREGKGEAGEEVGWVGWVGVGVVVGVCAAVGIWECLKLGFGRIGVVGVWDGDEGDEKFRGSAEVNMARRLFQSNTCMTRASEEWDDA